MFKQFSYQQKNKLLLPFTAVISLLCWYLAFSKTYTAVQVNRDLKAQTDTAIDLSFHPAYMQRKLTALKQILKSYQVNTTDWGNELWMKTSAMAMKHNAGIEYTIAAVEQDTASRAKIETIYCYGSFSQLVRLIDTIERSKNIGAIAALQLKSPKNEATGERAHQCVLQLEFKGITGISR